MIPARRLSPQAQAILDLIPLPTRPGVINNYVASGIEMFDNDSFDVRIDGRLSDR